MPEEQFVQTPDGLRLFTNAEGTGYPMLLCDGLGCDGFIWQNFRPAFRDKFRLVHFHFRGHGLSQVPQDAAHSSIEYLCSDIGTTLDAYNIDKVILVGHSMGVQLILQYAFDNPDRVAGLILICGAYGNPLRTFHDTSTADHLFPYFKLAIDILPRLSQRLWSGLADTEIAYQIATRLELNHKLLTRDAFMPYLQHVAGMDLQVFLNTLEHINRHTVEHRLPDIAMPTLVVAGEEDTFTPAWLSEHMADLLPNAELLMMPGGSHTAPIEIPELLHLRINQFLRERLPETLPKAQRPKRKRRTTTKKKIKSAKR